MSQVETLIKKMGEKKYKQWRKEIGAKGGTAQYKGKKGFAANPELARTAGSKGGKNRGKK